MEPVISIVLAVAGLGVGFGANAALTKRKAGSASIIAKAHQYSMYQLKAWV